MHKPPADARYCCYLKHGKTTKRKSSVYCPLYTFQSSSIFIRSHNRTSPHPLCLLNSTSTSPYHNLRLLLDKVNTLCNVTLEILQASVKKSLLVLSELADGVNVLDTVGAELDVRGKVLDALVLVKRAVDVGWLDDALLALSGLEQALGETGAGHGHGEGGGSGTALGLDDLVTTELDALDVLVALGALEVVAGLGEERDDGGARVTSDHGDGLVGWVGGLELGDEAGGTDDVEGGDTEKLLCVVDTLVLENFGGDWDSRVDLYRVSSEHEMDANVVLVLGWQ